jgi:FlaA1/EpsC-like NDP-sugar epimerase
VDLAKSILRLSGSPGRVGKDIVFTGIRPGEKLREKLVWPSEEDRMPTKIPKVHLVISRQQYQPGLMETVTRWYSDPQVSEDDIMEVFSPWLSEHPKGYSSQPWIPTHRPVY